MCLGDIFKDICYYFCLCEPLCMPPHLEFRLFFTLAFGYQSKNHISLRLVVIFYIMLH